MLKKTKGQSGITLVALVVTIVVLLILAGITIALVFAQNGVVGKAQEAAKESNKGTIADNIQGYVVSKQMEALQSNAEQDITADLKAALTKVGITNSGSGTVKVKADTTVAVTGTITFTLGGQSYNFTAYNNGYPTLEAASSTVVP
ncbi:type IV pilin [Clostridium sp. CAG:273]|nr:type IV pilin [Clostridium sp. CAG:273]